MTMHVNVSSTWKAINTAHVNVGGTWKDITAGYERVGGVWKQFFGQVTLNLDPKTDTYIDVANGVAGFTFGNGGILTRLNQGADSNEWVEEQPISSSLAADYEVAYTQLVSGDAPTTLAASLGVYVGLGTSRTWSHTTAVGATGTWRFRVREIANTSNFVEADLSISITITP